MSCGLSVITGTVLLIVLLFHIQLERLYIGHQSDGAAVWCTEAEHDTPGVEVGVHCLHIRLIFYFTFNVNLLFSLSTF